MHRDDRDDPFDDFFREIERMMNDMMGDQGEFHLETSIGGSESAMGTSDLHVDVQESDDRIRVVADLPGVEKENIDLTCDGQTLTIDAEGLEREYHDRVRLPARVDEHSADASYNNGILEVAFERTEDSRSIDL